MNLYKKNVVMPLDTEEGRLRDIGELHKESSADLNLGLTKLRLASANRNRQSREDLAALFHP